MAVGDETHEEPFLVDHRHAGNPILDEDLEHGPRGGVRSNAHRRTHYVL